MIVDFPKTLAIQSMNDSRERYGLELDDKAMTMTLARRNDPAAANAAFSYTRPEPTLLVLQGTLDGHKIKARRPAGHLGLPADQPGIPLDQ